MRNTLVKSACLLGVLWAAGAVADDLAARRNLAQTALLVGDYDRAVTLADEILARWPGDEGTHLIRGFALVGRGEFEAAERDLLIAHDAFPEDASVSYNLAVVAERRGDNREAFLYLEEALAHGLTKSDAYVLKAKLLDRLGRRAEARATLEYYLTRRPGTRDIYLTLAQWARADGDAEKAIEYYETALRYRRDGETLAELAATYEAAGERRLAIDFYLEAAAKGAGSPDILAEYAAHYAAASEFDQALEIYGRLVEQYPNNPYYLFGYSYVTQHLGDVATAHAGYLKVVRLQPDFPEPYYNLATLADADEKAEEAAAYFRKFLTHSAGRDDLAASRAKAEARLAILEGP